MKKRLARATAAIVAILTVVSAITLTTWHKTVTLTVDGETRQVSGLAWTVGDALQAGGVAVGEHDFVTPSVDQAVAEGSSIDVRVARPLEVSVDGKTTTHWTTETTLAAALRQLNIPVGDDDRLSEATSRALGREGLTLSITTAKPVKLVVAGQTKEVSSAAPTVADLLHDEKLTLGQHDRLSPSADTALTPDLTVSLDRVSVEETTRTEEIPFTTTKEDDASLDKGHTKTVTKGVKGTKTIVEKKITVNGTLESTEVVSTTVTKEPVNAVVKVGTRAPQTPDRSTGPDRTSNPDRAKGAGINLANAAMWDRIAKCESGGRWNINTGNGYYGGLQFNRQTWLSVGGADFAPRADLASREEQITVANRLYAKRGLQPWGCRHAA
ncbi:MAG: transglycosylase family protein [Propionibacteriaceae bacterium]|nr:transglycosylase family protein [Propionibacteriaceae bacterium]